MGKDRAFGAVEDYSAEELVVALPGFGVVKQALNDLQVSVHKKDSDNRLGLALLNVGNVAEAADRLTSKDDGLVQRVIEAKWDGTLPEGFEEPPALDVVLYQLRQNLSQDYGGWNPEFGKNRMISPVMGFPHVSGCLLGDPRQLLFADPKLITNGGVWPPRPTEPGHGVQVGLLDTRMYRNPWLDGGYLAAEDDLLEIPTGGVPAPEGHATFIAGLILHQAPGAQLIVHRAMGPQAFGKVWDVAKAMVEVAGEGAQILNLSFGCYTDDGQPPLVLAKAVQLLSRDVLLVAAAGNHGNIEELRAKGDPAAAADWMKNIKDRTPVWPAAFAEVTAVGATDANGGPAPFSPDVPWVDVTAQGVGVESTYLTGLVRLTSPAPGSSSTQEFGGFAAWDGTSFAAGTVSGAVAARIGPGRDAYQALDAALADRKSGVKRFP